MPTHIGHNIYEYTANDSQKTYSVRLYDIPDHKEQAHTVDIRVCSYKNAVELSKMLADTLFDVEVWQHNITAKQQQEHNDNIAT